MNRGDSDMRTFDVQGIETAAPAGKVFEFLPVPDNLPEITPELFRKRLPHARAAIEAFTRIHSGLGSDSAGCRCHRRAEEARWVASRPSHQSAAPIRGRLRTSDRRVVRLTPRPIAGRRTV
jgi:hypothetical protein